ncbi:MAG: GAF domain-containing protein, partial [Candidatus Omnitrophica bacterium]|nr:GAF domain-containing protein [Candidatus Omnitrophota bacterium]
MNLYSIPPLIASVLVLLLGLFIVIKNKKSLVNVVFGLDCFCVFTWLFGYFIIYNIEHQELAFFWCKIVYVGVIFIPPLFYHFIDRLLRLPRNRVVVPLNYFISVIFVILLFTSDSFVVGVYKYYWGYQTRVGFLHNLFLIFFATVLCIPFVKIYRRCKSEKDRSILEYNRSRYVLLTFITCFFSSLDFMPNYGIELYPFFGSIFVTAMVVLMTYTIAVYRLMDITIALTRAGIFTIVYALVLGLPFGVGIMLKHNFYRETTNWWLLPVFLMALLASLGPFIYMTLQKRIESRLRSEEFKSHEALRRLSHNMLRFANLENLLKLIVHQLVKILKLKFAAIYLFDVKRGKYILKNYWRPIQQLDSAFEPTREFSKDSSLIKDLYMRRLPIVAEEVKLFAPKDSSPHIKELLSSLSHLRANSVIPSFLRNELIGFVVLSHKRTNAAFTQEDLNLLMVLSNEVGLAVENAQFHQKEKMVLVQKSRREALADMAPGASHQFNNRLVAISS